MRVITRVNFSISVVFSVKLSDRTGVRIPVKVSIRVLRVSMGIM